MSTQPGTFTVRWGKLSLALAGVAAVVALPVLVVLWLIGSLSGLAPLLSLALIAVSLAGLRASAVQARRRRAWQRASETVPAALIESAREAKENSEELVAEQQAEPAKELKAAEDEVLVVADAPFDFMATTVEEESVEDAESAVADVVVETVAAPAAEAAPVERSWSPRELPAPKYADAQPVQRQAPEPLESTEDSSKASTIKSIRAAEAQRVAEERAERLDLDAVLQRRRA